MIAAAMPSLGRSMVADSRRFTGASSSSCGSRARRARKASSLEESNCIADGDVPGCHHPAIEGQLAVKIPMNFLQHGEVLLRCIGIERRHDAAGAKLHHLDDGAAHL